MDFSLGVDIGSALGGLAGLIGANASSSRQFKYQSMLQQQAAQLNYDYSMMSAKNMPSKTRQGLEKAGYNPMLAVQNGTSGANASFTSAGQAQNVDYAGALSSGLNNVLSIQNIKNQTKQTEATADEAYANADKAKAEKATLLERMPWISKREKAEIGNIEKDSMKKEAEIHNLEETTRFIEKDYELRRRLGEMGIYVGANTAKYQADKAYNATTYAADVAAHQSGTNANKQLAGDIAKALVGAGLAIFVGNKVKLIKPVGDLIKVIPKNILLK